MAFRTFAKLETRTLKPNRFQNQSSGTLKLTDEGLLNKKCCSPSLCFKLKFPKYCYCDRYFS